MNAYLITYTFYYDGLVNKIISRTALLSEPYKDNISGDDFDGLWNLSNTYCVVVPFNAFEYKGKRYLEFYNKTFGRKVTPANCKPWRLTITSKEIDISMERLMKFNTEDVIQYLKERGMTACPIIQ